MAKKVILGTDIARDAFKTKVNENFTELYNKDVALGEQINSLDAEVDLKASKTRGEAFTATLQNGFTESDGTPNGILYSKNDVGIVWLRGYVIAGSTVADGTVIATLPAGYRPL